MTTRPAPLETVNRIKSERYPEANVILAAGSVMRGEGTPASDLDLYVLFDSVDDAYRESFTFEGWPVEAFVHDEETATYFINKDRESGHPATISMIKEGLEVPGPTELSARLKQKAAEAYAAGPEPMKDEDIRAWRYAFTTFLEDIQHPRGPEDRRIMGGLLYSRLAEQALRMRVRWGGTDRQALRGLKALDVALAERYVSAFNKLFDQDDVDGVTAIVHELLKPYGGLLFDGYHRPAGVPSKQKPG
jgi:hypothetical protein